MGGGPAGRRPAGGTVDDDERAVAGRRSGPRSWHSGCRPDRSSCSPSAPSSSTAPTCRSTPTSWSPPRWPRPPSPSAATRSTPGSCRRWPTASPTSTPGRPARSGCRPRPSSAVLDDLGRCAAMTPARRLVFLNGHGGNSALLGVALRELRLPPRPAHVPGPPEPAGRPGRRRRRSRSSAWASTAAPTRRRSCCTSVRSGSCCERRRPQRPRGPGRQPPRPLRRRRLVRLAVERLRPEGHIGDPSRPRPSGASTLFEGAVAASARRWSRSAPSTCRSDRAAERPTRRGAPPAVPARSPAPAGVRPAAQTPIPASTYSLVMMSAACRPSLSGLAGGLVDRDQLVDDLLDPGLVHVAEGVVGAVADQAEVLLDLGRELGHALAVHPVGVVGLDQLEDQRVGLGRVVDVVDGGLLRRWARTCSGSRCTS